MASQLTHADVLRIAELARLQLAEGEAATMARQLAAILEYAATIQRVDTSTVPHHPAGPSGETESLREDRVEATLDRAVAISAAPEANRDAGLFRVPKVL